MSCLRWRLWGTSVDNSFYQIFVKLVGAPLLNAMKREDPTAYLDIFRELEAVKRTVDKTKQDKVTMSIPRAVLDDICKKHLGEDLAAIIKSSPYNDRMELRYDKMRIEAELIEGLFNEASNKIVQLIAKALAEVVSRNISVILLVGGFSECKILQDSIKAKFPSHRVVVPEDAGLAVLKGAVLFGHKPEYIVSRVVRYTYGIGITRDFNPDIHEPARRKIVNGNEECKNIFKIYLKTGSVVDFGEHITKKHKTAHEFQSKVSFRVFQST